MKLITSKAEYEAIMARIDELVEIVDDNTPQTDKNYIELDFLTDLVVFYEKEHYPIGKSAGMDISDLFIASPLNKYTFASH